MNSNYITEDELNQFRSLSVKNKVDSMEAYLIGVNGHRYNMQEVGSLVFGQENYSFTVSLIHRCYNFSGQNGGKYRNGCKFEQTYRYRVTSKDIEAFVKKYPDGTFSQGITFDDFLMTRLNSAKQDNPKSKKQPAQRKTQSIERNVLNAQYTNPNNYYNGNDQIANEKMRSLMIGIGSVGVLILLIMLVTGGLFRHWIISLVILFFTFGAFGYLKEFK